MRTKDLGLHAPEDATRRAGTFRVLVRAVAFVMAFALAPASVAQATPVPAPGSGLAATAMGPAAAAAAAHDLVGTWEGVLEVPGGSLRLVLHLVADGEGGYTATLDSPDQGATGIPAAEAVVEGDVLRLSIPTIGARYEGRIDFEAEVIRGTFTQGMASLPLELRRVEEVSGPNRPQTPRPPFPYDEEDVVYPNAEAGITLAGTLALPHLPGPHPAVVLITGSGPQDRDETVFDHKPFLIISDHLARRGIAVLRVDDRGVGQSTGDFDSATSLDFTSDVAAGVEFLKSRPEIDGARIGLIGHSEGGLIAPLVAVESDDVAFIVLLAAPGLTGEEILYLQAERIMRANGATSSAIAANRAVQATIFEVILEEADQARRSERLHEALTRLLEESGGELGVPPSQHEAFIQSQLRATTGEWFRFFLMHDPVPVLERVRVPVLALNGGKDLQIPAAENLVAIEAALRAGGNPDFEVRELSGLNHLFQTAKTGSPVEYAQIEETFSPIALEAVTEWILRVTSGS